MDDRRNGKIKVLPKEVQNVAVVYARYSSHGQTEQSIEGQLAAAKTYANAKGYKIIHEYIDRAMTGRNDNREDFQQMLSDTAKGQFGVIILWKVDRFGRNREEITFNKYRCKKNGVRVEYVAENVPSSAEGVILESVLEGMAEYYSLQLSQNVKRGLYESAKKHHVIGGNLPLGYKMGENKEYEIDPETAPTVKLIFDMYADGSTISEIVKYLNVAGYRTRAGKEFTVNSLTAALKNEKYIGRYKYKDIIDDEDVIPAIIEKETFYKVQEMMKINRRAPSHRWNYSDYLLTDKLFCGKCGSQMVGESGIGKKGVKYNYYTCIKHRKEKTCNKKAIRADKLEQLIIYTIVEQIIKDDNVLDFIADCTWQYYQSIDTTRDEVALMKSQIDDTDKKMNNLIKAMESGVTSDAVVNRIKELETQKEALITAVAEKELEYTYKITKERISFFLHQFQNMDYDDRHCQHRIIDVFVNAIFLYDDEIKIIFNYDKNSTSTVTLDELNDAEAVIDDNTGFVRCAPSPALAITYKPIIWFSNVFVIDIKIPGR